MEKIRQILNNIWAKALGKWNKMDMRQRVYFSIAVVVCFVLLWAFITAGVITANFSRNALHSGADKQEFKVSSMILTETKNGQKFWEIFGETGKYSSDHKVANLTNVVGNFYKNNQVDMSFEASKGLYNEETQEIIIYENVLVVLKDETAVTADKLVFHIKEKRLDMDGNVRINRKNKFIATANRAVIDSKYSRFRIIGNAKSKIYK